jgi:hypothetical protein
MRTLLVIVVLIVIAFFGFTKYRYNSFDPCQAAALSYREKVQGSMEKKLEGSPEGMLLQLLGPALQPLIDAFLTQNFGQRPVYECVAMVPYLETPWGHERADHDAERLIEELRKNKS